MKRKVQTRSSRIAAVLVSLLLLLAIMPVQAGTSGPNYPATGTDSNLVGTLAWTNLSQVTSLNGQGAVAFVNGSGTTHYLVTSGYGFDLPEDALIQGIEVTITRSALGAGVADSVVSLWNGSAVIGENEAQTAQQWPTSGYAPATYGGDDDDWGAELTPAVVNTPGFGVALSAAITGSGFRVPRVDTIGITITYTLNTSTTVDCGSGPFTPGSEVTCQATVSVTSEEESPTGTITWTTGGAGSFDSTTCDLAGSGTSASCSAAYTPSAAGDHLITASYAGVAGSLEASSGSVTITVAKINPLLSITNSPATYTGSPQEAVIDSDVEGTISGVLYDGEANPPTDAGTYAVTADFTPDDTDLYNTLSGVSVGSFVIAKADPTLSVTNSPVLFTGEPQEAVVEGSVEGTVSNIRYDGAETVPSAPGVYAITADFTPTDAVNYTTLSGAPAGNFIISAGEPALDLAKTASPTTFSQAGVEIEYSYVLTNIGDVPLSGPFSVTDDLVTTVTCPDTGTLATGASITCTGSYTTVEADVTAGLVTNTATAQGSSAGTPITSNSDSVTVTYSLLQYHFPLIWR